MSRGRSASSAYRPTPAKGICWRRVGPRGKQRVLRSPDDLEERGRAWRRTGQSLDAPHQTVLSVAADRRKRLHVFLRGLRIVFPDKPQLLLADAKKQAGPRESKKGETVITDSEIIFVFVLPSLSENPVRSG
ncbi:hypothetical protein NDU88_004250 [Pleurodeles waltl]|uniref:Uncharacterized protein n=1 Tax=Pleurodeles waltl TaxID=8319 RepID=A0AAV7UEF5_PLEWA|nr:hypothetical protein NDU88_004250 [Pleurodeles waltl]